MTSSLFGSVLFCSPSETLLSTLLAFTSTSEAWADVCSSVGNDFGDSSFDGTADDGGEGSGPVVFRSSSGSYCNSCPGSSSVFCSGGQNRSAGISCSPFINESTTTSLSGNFEISDVPSSYLILILDPFLETAATLPPYHFLLVIFLPSRLTLVAKRTFTLSPEATCFRHFFSDMFRAHSRTSNDGGGTTPLFFFFFLMTGAAPSSFPAVPLGLGSSCDARVLSTTVAAAPAACSSRSSPGDADAALELSLAADLTRDDEGSTSASPSASLRTIFFFFFH
mmetsp:Transcript_18075/g.31687  ORF Transcript_18075/g.31687 Transcript_18075/m.31687 type:complete len:280 (+) Transcript_18075:4846-5685(+)